MCLEQYCDVSRGEPNGAASPSRGPGSQSLHNCVILECGCGGQQAHNEEVPRLGRILCGII